MGICVMRTSKNERGQNRVTVQNSTLESPASFKSCPEACKLCNIG